MPRTAKGTRHLFCADCGEAITRGPGDDRPCCLDCASRRVVGHVEAMRNKAGPTYEKVVRGQLRHWTAEAERLGIPASDAMREAAAKVGRDLAQLAARRT